MSRPPHVSCSGKTSLLFHFARAAAAATGRDAYLLTSRARAEAGPPALPPGVEADDAALERVQVK